MGTSLNGLTPQNTYPALIKVGDNTALSATAKVISDGLGNDSILALSITAVGIGTNAPTARLHIKGSGSTSATTSLLVQNSAGSPMLTIRDNGEAFFNIARTGNGFQIADGDAPSQLTAFYQKGGVSQITTRGSASLRYFFWSSSAEFPNGHFAYNFDQLIVSDVQKDLDAAKAASAVLQADSTTKGFLPPRMTTAQKNAIATPAAGLMVYDTTLNKLCVRAAAAWETITSV